MLSSAPAFVITLLIWARQDRVYGSNISDDDFYKDAVA